MENDKKQKQVDAIEVAAQEYALLLVDFIDEKHAKQRRANYKPKKANYEERTGQKEDAE